MDESVVTPDKTTTYRRRRDGSEATGARRSSKRALGRVPWWFVIPGVASILVLRYLPSIAGGTYAFTDWTGAGLSAHWTGVANFRQVLSDSATGGAVWRTILLAIAFVIVVNVVGIALAVSLRAALRTRTLLRALFFLPFTLSQLATAYIWQFILAYDGPVNALLKAVGLGSLVQTWLSSPIFAILAVLVVLVWQYTGLTMIVYLAGLESISEELDEAASVDGASFGQKFRHVTFPLLAPAMTIAVTLTLIYGLGAFDQIIGLTGGGPVDSTQTLATQVWQQTFVYGKYGEGSALALIFAIVVSVLSLGLMAVLRMREERLQR
ncbi:MAG TPA: sugar ABC transporter permease [Gryllotalpicola sp.]